MQPEGPALGAALLAAVGAGAFASVADAAKTIRRRPAVAPRADVHRAYDEPYARFPAALSGAARRAMSDLHELVNAHGHPVVNASSIG